MLAYLSQTSLRPCDVVRQMFAGSRHHKTSSHPLPPLLPHKREECNWSPPQLAPTLPRTQQGTYRPINKHCQCMLQVATGDLEGLPWLEYSQVCAILQTPCLRAKVSSWWWGGGAGDQPPLLHKQNTQIPAPSRCHKTLESFPQVASTAESRRAVQHIMSEFISFFCLSCEF